jgi:hypothetical protein
MLSKPISASVFFSLALAILMAWAGHTSALFTGSGQQTRDAETSMHGHTHGDEAPACAAFGNHCHSPLTADHVHETPHLTTPLSLGRPSERGQPMDALSHSVPPSPIFLIERPPRATSVL